MKLKDLLKEDQLTVKDIHDIKKQFDLTVKSRNNLEKNLAKLDKMIQGKTKGWAQQKQWNSFTEFKTFSGALGSIMSKLEKAYDTWNDIWFKPNNIK